MKKILVVVDCQNDFITGSLANEEAQKRVPNIVKKINDFDGDAIFLTRDTHTEDYLNTSEGKNLPVVHCVANTPGWEIESSVAEAFTNKINDENTKTVGIVLNKEKFGSVALPEYLHNLVAKFDDPVFEIEFVGFCTDICVVSNAIIVKNLFLDEAVIKVDASCCAGVTPESHNAALLTMKMCQIDIVNE